MSDPATVTLYSTSWCPFCVRAIELLKRKAVNYVDINVDGQPEKRQEMAQRAGRRTVPQIWVGESHVGGCDELFALERSGELDIMLRGSKHPT